MTSPVFVVDGAALESAAPGSLLTVDGGEGRHAVTVRRIRSGELVDLVDGAGTRATGEVTSVVGKDAFEVRISRVSVDPPPDIQVTVVQALPKGDRGELAVELLTEIGVDDILPWAAANCVTQWRPDRVDRARQKWIDASLAAAKQSRRARFPVVHPLAATPDVEGLIARSDVALVLHEDARTPIGEVEIPAQALVVLVVGPEGGLTLQEVDAFEGAGAQCVRLGPSVLRTSSAGMAAAAALLARSARWVTIPEADVPPRTSVEG